MTIINYFLAALVAATTTAVSLNNASQRGVHTAIKRFIDRWKTEDEVPTSDSSQFSTLELLNRSIETMQNTIFINIRLLMRIDHI